MEEAILGPVVGTGDVVYIYGSKVLIVVENGSFSLGS